jgi:hypothetical protein
MVSGDARRSETPQAETKRKPIKKRRTQTAEIPQLPPTPKATSQAKVAQELSDQQVDEGSDARFQCKFEGVPDDARVVW